MGTFLGHLAPGIVLLVMGGWHIFSAISSHTKSLRDHVARIWHPIGKSKLRNLELYLLIAFLAMAISYELIMSMTDNSGFSTARIFDMQGAVVFLGFLITALLALVMENSSSAASMFLVSSIAFFIESWSLFQRQNASLEGKCRAIQGVIAIACTASSGILAWNPKVFLAEVILAGGVLLQGSWMIQSAFSLYVVPFIPEGCHRLMDLPFGTDGSTQCDIENARVRAEAIMDLAFMCHALASIVCIAIVYGIVSKIYGHRRGGGGGGYDSLSNEDVESSHNSNIALKPIVKQAQF